MTKRAAAHALAVTAAMLAGPVTSARASSHREAPFITENPKIDGTDFYMFRSYETGREDYVTILANYIPLQDAYGGPNYFAFDPDALYEIHVDNDGDATEDLTFQFRFTNSLKDLRVPVDTATRTVSVPLINIGGLSAGSEAALNVEESYSITLVRGDRRTGAATPVIGVGDLITLRKPTDYIGGKTFADYGAYADSFIHEINVPGCNVTGRVFVGQRREGFVVNLGPIFDLVNFSLAEVTGNCGANRDRNTIGTKNVTTIGLELPIACLTSGGDPVIGAWTTASLRQGRAINPLPTFDLPAREGGPWVQVSRLGHPLVNEVVIGLKDKNLFNAAHPTIDGALAEYVTHPTLPELVEILFGALAGGDLAPNYFPRTDLVTIFLTGIPGLNQPMNVTGSEMLRLNTSIDPTPPAMQSPLGVFGADNAGFPNGRRPVDDVVDIALRAAMGAAIPLFDPPAAARAPAAAVPFTDCADTAIGDYRITFPYLAHPLPGAGS